MSLKSGIKQENMLKNTKGDLTEQELEKKNLKRIIRCRRELSKDPSKNISKKANNICKSIKILWNLIEWEKANYQNGQQKEEKRLKYLSIS